MDNQQNEDEDMEDDDQSFDPEKDEFPQKVTESTEPLERHLVEALQSIRYEEKHLIPQTTLEIYIDTADNGSKTENILRHTWYNRHAAGRKSTQIKKVLNPMNQTIRINQEAISMDFVTPRMHRIEEDIQQILKEIALTNVRLNDIVLWRTTPQGKVADKKQSEQLYKHYAGLTLKDCNS